jgi:hypothetical protein
MSMNAVFVQVDPAELTRIKAEPSLVEALFQDGPMIPPAFAQLSETIQARIRARGPEMMANVFSQLDPRIRQRFEERLGQSTSSLASGQGGDAILKLMQDRGARATSMAKMNGPREKLSLDKEWHGVHYVLCGEVEPGTALLSQAVMGGTAIGEDDEGFSGYGPARFFSREKVNDLAKALSRPELEAEAAGRFDAAKMSRLGIYPGWRDTDATGVMDALRRLRDFYSDAASKGHGIVTCLV